MTIRVLIADDHAMMRDGLKALLSASPDISVIAEVSNGREAVRRAEELRPDVVVMDVAMPELNGIEAARMLRDRCPETRIVILSMHSSSEHVFRAFEAGAAGYLLKESAGTEAEAAVRAVHDGRRYLSRAIAARRTPGRSTVERVRWTVSARASARCCSSWSKATPAPRSRIAFTFLPRVSKPTAAG
jgi:DNA-binding NarL/FixJ family response regulator